MIKHMYPIMEKHVRQRAAINLGKTMLSTVLHKRSIRAEVAGCINLNPLTKS